MRIHALRHGHATAGLEHGLALEVMSERLGHAWIQNSKKVADELAHVSRLLTELLEALRKARD